MAGPTAHAKLSPSSAERWISCPASVRVIAQIPPTDDSSPYAAEGTHAHALGELKVQKATGVITGQQYATAHETWRAQADDSWDLDEMEEHTDAYVALVLERAQLYPYSQVLTEQRMDTGVPESWGTSDIVIVSPQHVEIIDLKYGSGVAVSAVGNPQLRLYACGAMDTFADLLGSTEVVRVTVFQPRIGDGHASTEELSPQELRAWRRDVVIPAANEAHGDDARFGPSPDACRWCPAAGQCRARIEKMTQEDFGTPPDLISDEDMAELVLRLPDIRSWVKDVEEAALDRAYSQKRRLPGLKVVRSGGQRKVSDEAKATEVLVANGYPLEAITLQKLRGIGELEKLIKARAPRGKKKDATLESVLGNELVTKPPGSPSLVPDTDPRPGIDPHGEAAKDFS